MGVDVGWGKDVSVYQIGVRREATGNSQMRAKPKPENVIVARDSCSSFVIGRSWRETAVFVSRGGLHQRTGNCSGKMIRILC